MGASTTVQDSLRIMLLSDWRAKIGGSGKGEPAGKVATTTCGARTIHHDVYYRHRQGLAEMTTVVIAANLTARRSTLAVSLKSGGMCGKNRMRPVTTVSNDVVDVGDHPGKHPID